MQQGVLVYCSISNLRATTTPAYRRTDARLYCLSSVRIVLKNINLRRNLLVRLRAAFLPISPYNTAQYVPLATIVLAVSVS